MSSPGNHSAGAASQQAAGQPQDSESSRASSDGNPATPRSVSAASLRTDLCTTVAPQSIRSASVADRLLQEHLLSSSDAGERQFNLSPSAPSSSCSVLGATSSTAPRNGLGLVSHLMVIV
ncbi:unnamed protein product [Amoebophrya sp. A25]|nr:unnamed protein product [Amoebophrya sp. A25]|eukprot:GSA25T00010856001.1